MANSLYPGFLKLYYTTVYGAHIATLPVDPRLDSGVWKLADRTETLYTIAAAMTTFLNAFKQCFHTGVVFDYVETWSKASATADPVYRQTDNLNVAGTNAGASVQACQMTWSFRTSAGGNGKLVALDVSSGANLRLIPPSYGFAAFLAVANYLLSSACVIMGRDTSYPVSVPKVLTKTNDALRKKYNLV